MAKPGRPPLDADDPTVNIHIRIPSKQYDEAFRLASSQKVTVPEMIRRALKAAADKQPSE
jgi:hypothetical protein